MGNVESMDNKAVRMKFVGYDESAKGFRLIDQNYKIHVDREVNFCRTNKKFNKRRIVSDTQDDIEEEINDNTHLNEEYNTDNEWWFGIDIKGSG